MRQHQYASNHDASPQLDGRKHSPSSKICWRKIRFSYPIGSTVICEKPCHKDLGITISTDLSWTNHYNRISKAAYKTLNLLQRSISKEAPISTKKLLYLSLVRSRLLYCSPVWRPNFVLAEFTVCKRRSFIARCDSRRQSPGRQKFSRFPFCWRLHFVFSVQIAEISGEQTKMCFSVKIRKNTEGWQHCNCHPYF